MIKKINSNVIKYFKSLQKNKIPGITNITPSYNKLIISFDLENIKYEQLKRFKFQFVLMKNFV